MGILSSIAAFGIWPSLPIVGGWLLPRSPPQSSKLVDWGLRVAAGIALWSLPLLLLAEFGVHDAALLGLIGWGVVCQYVQTHFRGPRPRRRKWSQPEMWLVFGLLLAAVLYFGFPTESLLGGRDEGIYANVGVFLAENGHFEVPFPWRTPSERPQTPLKYPGFRASDSGFTPQFSHLLPAWLAQAWASLGPFGLFRLNGAFALVALLCFYGVARKLLSPSWSVVVTLFLAFNPSQVWIARITLSEVLGQLFIWAALLTLCRGEKEQGSGWMLWAGFFSCLGAAARIDGFVLFPLLLATHALVRLATPGKFETSRRFGRWGAVYATAVPGFLLVFSIYRQFSPSYFGAFAGEVRAIGEASLAFGLLMLVLRWTGFGMLARLARTRWVLGVVLAAFTGGAAYGSWVRPWLRTSLLEAKVPPEHLHHYLALPKLMEYLSPAVLWLAIVGVGWVLWRVLHRGERWLAAPLVLWLGFTVLYLYDPVIHPLHYWAVRRHVPVVIPGFLLFAVCGWEKILSMIPRKAARRLALASVLGFTIFTVSIGKPLYFFTELRGVVDQLEEVAAELPEDKLILVPMVQQSWIRWATPLFVSFDRRLAPMEVRSPRGRRAADRWIRRRLGEGEDVFLLYNGKILPKSWPPMEKVGQYVLRTEILRPTVEPVARDVLSQAWHFDLYFVQSTSEAPRDR